MLPIEKLENELAVEWPNIRKARELAINKRDELSKCLSRYSEEDSTVVVFGSLARNEFTDGSDIDWTLLIDGRAKSEHFTIKNEIADAIAGTGANPPGNEGTFGSLAFSHDLIHNIGGNDDTNKNTTRRILLLLESASVTDKEALERVLKEVLSRYINEDWGVLDKAYQVPRFLLNDIVRYWRTMCVDFAYKRRKEQKNWALRTLKLRMSRKLIYAAGLLACFSCKMDNAFADEVASTHDVDEQRELIISNLFSVMRHTPLDIMASIILSHKDLYAPARQLFGNYDKFLSLLSDEETRFHLKNLLPDGARTDETYARGREIASLFQAGLDDIFFETKNIGLFDLTKKYGVF